MRPVAALLLCGLWLPALAAVPAAPPAAPPAAMIEAVDVADVLDQTIPDKLQIYDIPGAAVAVVQAGEVIALRGYGSVDPVRGVALDPERHVFRIGSVSKPLTATVVLRLAAERGLDLHADLRQRLASLPVRPPLEVPLTLHQLLTHTAGFNERLFGQHVRDPDDLLTLSGYLRAHLPPRFIDPGPVIAYNDHHTVLAAWIAEQVTGTAFDALAEDLLLGPLGMRSSTFRQIDQPAPVTANLTPAWHRQGGAWQPYPRDYVHTAPAAGAFASAPDMARYLIALLECRAPVFDAARCRQQLARQAAHHDRLPGRAYGFAEGRHGEARVLYKDGQASGFNARLLLLPAHRLGVFVVHNRNILGRAGTFAPAARFNREVTAAVLDVLLPEAAPVTAAPTPANGAAQRVARYAGDYRNVVAARHTWERLAGMFDDVHVTASGAGVEIGGRRYVEVAPGLVQWHDGGDRYAAFAVADGVATHLFIGSGAYERVPFYGASWFTPWFVLAAVVWFAAAIVVGCLGWRGSGRLVHALPAGALLAFLVGLAALLGTTDVQTLFYGAPAALLALLALPLLGGAALLAQTLWLALNLRDPGSGTGLWRQAFTAASIAAGVVFLLWLNYWNLLGYRLG